MTQIVTEGNKQVIENWLKELLEEQYENRAFQHKKKKNFISF